MPAFQALKASKVTGKRSAPEDTSSRKRVAVDNGDTFQSHSGADSHGRHQYWMIQWRAPQYKKHKTWDGDAVLVLDGNKGTMYDLDGKLMGTGVFDAQTASEGAECSFSGREIGLDHAISRDEYLSGACFGRGTPASAHQSTYGSSSSGLNKQFVPLRPSKASTPLRLQSKSERKVIPLYPVNATSSESKTRGEISCWTANWRKPQGKKHKTWDESAFVTLDADILTLMSEAGKLLGRREWDGLPLHGGYQFMTSGKEVELDSQIPSSQIPKISGTAELDTDEHEKCGLAAETFSVCRTPGDPDLTKDLGKQFTKNFVPPSTFYGKAPSKPKPKGPLHDPQAEGAIIMKPPSKEQLNKSAKKHMHMEVIPVVLDPILARHLRPHQIEGLKFMYECVMGLRKHEGQGCILADEMGLGKTLQTIALVWTLLRQNPYAEMGPVIGKVMIVCPVSLINNWRAEFHKWLGRDRIGIFTGDKDRTAIKQFVNSKNHQVLIIGYEKLRTVITELAYCQPPIGLIICDEGHRLKSANNKTSTMFKVLRTPRRVILSGTPIQNDLSEFHAMADFCNPGLLDDYATFRRVYEVPILNSRAPGCTSKETELGEARSAQLSTIAKSFVLRREATILKNYLPPKHEYVVFVTPTELQLSIFAVILDANRLDHLMESSTAESLALINLLTKISNSPVLLKATVDKAKAAGKVTSKRSSIDTALQLLPEKVEIEDFSLSGKLTALSNLLKTLREYTEEKCIIVSHYTSTLNIIEAFCKKKSYTYHRLDGQTPAAKRQEYVNSFNKSSQQSRFLFLLSSKAGGVGLNLIGASRLCLIDSDWNPSHDLQSMARIHRDGQKRPVFIYRFLTAGTIDEKIYQRQVTKIGLSNSLMGSGTSGSKMDSFSRKDLRDIFRVHPDTPCNTHDLLECSCNESDKPVLTDVSNIPDVQEVDEDMDSETGFVIASQIRSNRYDKLDQAYLSKKKAELAALGEWTHINCLHALARDDIQDDILRQLVDNVQEVKEENLDETGAAGPQSKIDSLLTAVDLDNIAAIDQVSPQQSVRDFPGGTISFLFEKTSLAKLDGEAVDEIGNDL